MRHEHAITYSDQLTIADLEYLIKKSNKHGRNGREVIRVHEERDSEGIHVYFDIIGMADEQQRI